MPLLRKICARRTDMATSPPHLRNNNGPVGIASPPETQHAPLIDSENERHSGNAINGSVRVVMQRPHQRFFLLPLVLNASASSRDIMKALQQMKNQEASRIKVLKPARQSLWTTVIEIVNLSSFRFADLEALPSQHPLEVIVSSRTPSAELTAAFHRSWLLQSSTSFGDQYPALIFSWPSRTALLIGQELNKSAFFWMLSAALLVSLVIGLVVGLVCSRADLAVAITGGLTGIISVLTALLVWMLK